MQPLTATSSHAERAAGQYLITPQEVTYISLCLLICLSLDISLGLSAFLSVPTSACSSLFPSVPSFVSPLYPSIHLLFSRSHSLLIGVTWLCARVYVFRSKAGVSADHKNADKKPQSNVVLCLAVYFYITP